VKFARHAPFDDFIVAVRGKGNNYLTGNARAPEQLTNLDKRKNDGLD
jgi:hypothetical protein